MESGHQYLQQNMCLKTVILSLRQSIRQVSQRGKTRDCLVPTMIFRTAVSASRMLPDPTGWRRRVGWETLMETVGIADGDALYAQSEDSLIA